ncbi:hypothetical protein A2U01_0108902, partial [Trifolium medium]|nr:hypothetical protein [Trifolium medium]
MLLLSLFKGSDGLGCYTAQAEGRAGPDGDDIVREMEEELEREGDEDSSKVRRPAWVNPYEGQPVPK